MKVRAQVLNEKELPNKLIYHTEAERETRAELAMQIQAKDQLKYKGKDMLCDSNNKFDSGFVPHGDDGHSAAAPMTYTE